MQLETKHFGSIEIDEKGIVDFIDGIPGFESLKRFVVLGNGASDSPFRWLQSIDDLKLAFAIVDPLVIKPDYDIEIDDEVIGKLGIEKAQDVTLYSIVVVPEDISGMTMNLKAPIIINTKNNQGAQIVLDTDRYGVRHYIMEELRKQEVAANACTDKEEGSVNCNK